MKKVFPLSLPNHEAPRVVERIKAEVRKYLKREHRKPLPEGVDFWDFDCRVGRDEEAAVGVHLSEVIGAIDGVAAAGGEAVYVEIFAKRGLRVKKVVVDEGGAEGEADDFPEGKAVLDE